MNKDSDVTPRHIHKSGTTEPRRLCTWPLLCADNCLLCVCVVYSLQVESERLIVWLDHVLWASWNDQPIVCTVSGMYDIASQLSAMQALQYTDEATQGSVVLKLECSMDAHHVDMLQALPEWGGTIDMSECTWPMRSSQYTHLAEVIPTTYTKWVLSSAPRAVALTAHRELRRHREELGLPPVTVEARNLRTTVCCDTRVSTKSTDAAQMARRDSQSTRTP